MKKVLVILGPTATGKTDLALRLATLAQGKPSNFPQCELVSCDSRQVYIGLDIGTGKDLPVNSKFKVKSPTCVKASAGRQKYQIGYYLFDKVPVWMLDVVSPKTQYSVADYTEQASKVLEDILKRGKLPIIVGGTGLYLKALLSGLPNLSVPIDLNLRKELEKLSLEDLQKKLESIFLRRWETMNDSDRKNPRRLIRAIELVTSSLREGRRGDRRSNPYSIGIATGRSLDPRDDNLLKIGLSAPRQILYERINQRLISRIDQGMIREAENLHKNGLSLKRMKELGLEYGVLADLLEGKINKEQFINILSTKIHQYAKRQMTWFKKDKDVCWFDIQESAAAFDAVEKEVKSWYNMKNDTPN